jgi:hypothetical protein
VLLVEEEIGVCGENYRMITSLFGKKYMRNKCISYPRSTDDFRKSDRWVNTSAAGLLVSEVIINPVVIVSALTWFIRYIYA